jgi:hypothetical protein
MLTPLLDAQLLDAFEVTRPLPEACTVRNQPMWPAGSFAALSPAQSFLYVLFGANLLPSVIFGDAKCASIDVVLIDTVGARNTVSISCYRTGFGEIRIRIPMTPRMAVRSIEVPVARLMKRGTIRGPFLQNGSTVRRALASQDILLLEPPLLRYRGLSGSDRCYSATADDGVLVIDIPTQSQAVAVLSIGLVALDGSRMLASE